MKSIKIRNLWTGSVVFEYTKEIQSPKRFLEAIRCGADLRDANLCDAYLRGADLCGAKGCYLSCPTESPICGPDDGLSAGLDGITFPAWCRGSIKAYGNAIVPQVALRIFETINEYEGL